jgi:6-pyruvoyltetrahydropterin/6-carboxytetrahydropterin synthase
MSHSALRYHDISCGHRVVGHEGKCRYLHGHNYRVHFACVTPSLDSVGRVVDFSVMKDKLCMWLEDVLDHRMLIWVNDPILAQLQAIDPTIVVTPFNPTAENIAKYLVEDVGPRLLEGTGVTLQQVVVEETRKCAACYTKEKP